MLVYGEKYLDAKAFPHLHPYGHGGQYHKCPMAFRAHTKMEIVLTSEGYMLQITATVSFFKSLS